MIKHEARTLAQAQHGLVATWQLRHIATRGQIDHEMRASGNWTKVDTQIFRLAGCPPSTGSAVMQAVLAAGPGAAVARWSAAALWGLPGFNLTPAHVVRSKSTNSARTRHPLTHESRHLPGEDVVVLRGLPVTTPSRTVLDLARTVHPDRSERILEAAWSRNLLGYDSVEACCDRLGPRGRPEVIIVRAHLAKRGPDWVPSASNLESRLNQILERHALGHVDRQVNLGGRRWLGRVDFLHESGLVIEVQSELHHGALTSREDDRIRLAALEAAGFRCIEVWDNDVWTRPNEVARRIRSAIMDLRNVA